LARVRLLPTPQRLGGARLLFFLHLGEVRRVSTAMMSRMR
jgi:hypothetical protein